MSMRNIEERVCIKSFDYKRNADDVEVYNKLYLQKREPVQIKENRYIDLYDIQFTKQYSNEEGITYMDNMPMNRQDLINLKEEIERMLNRGM